MSETASVPNTESLEHNVNIAWDVAHDVKPIMDSAIASEKGAAELESKIQPYDGDDDLTFEENERFNQELMDEVTDSREFAATQRKDAKELAEIYAQDYHDAELLSEDRVNDTELAEEAAYAAKPNMDRAIELQKDARDREQSNDEDDIPDGAAEYSPEHVTGLRNLADHHRVVAKRAIEEVINSSK